MTQPTPTRRFHLGLIGYPLGHSNSPRLHHAALEAAGFAGEYRLFPIPPGPDGQSQIASMIEDLRRCDLQGLNVTIPHKQNVFPFIDVLSEVAKSVGAANCLWGQDGLIYGDNTDVPGFLHDLAALGVSAPGVAVILGAGGSARAAAFALASTSWEVQVLARREEQAAGLVESLARAGSIGNRLASGTLDRANLERWSDGCRLLVNTTPLGMHPAVDGCPWPEDLPLPAAAAVYDLIYNPIETTLLRRARAAGLRTRNGAGMLVAQAALSFQHWTGSPAPYAVMERAFFAPLKVNTQ